MKPRILYSVNLYDHEGDVMDQGVYLHFSDVIIKVCDTPADFPVVVGAIQAIARELAERVSPALATGEKEER